MICESNQVNIRQYSEEVTSRLRNERDSDDFWDRFLDVTLYRNVRDRDSYVVEFLLTCGGPHVEVRVDSRFSPVLIHSWGCSDDGDPQTECTLFGDDAGFWDSLAEEWNELCE